MSGIHSFQNQFRIQIIPTRVALLDQPYCRLPEHAECLGTARLGEPLTTEHYLNTEGLTGKFAKQYSDKKPLLPAKPGRNTGNQKRLGTPCIKQKKEGRRHYQPSPLFLLLLRKNSYINSLFSPCHRKPDQEDHNQEAERSPARVPARREEPHLLQPHPRDLVFLCS